MRKMLQLYIILTYSWQIVLFLWLFLAFTNSRLEQAIMTVIMLTEYEMETSGDGGPLVFIGLSSNISLSLLGTA